MGSVRWHSQEYRDNRHHHAASNHASELDLNAAVSTAENGGGGRASSRHHHNSHTEHGRAQKGGVRQRHSRRGDNDFAEPKSSKQHKRAASTERQAHNDKQLTRHQSARQMTSSGARPIRGGAKHHKRGTQSPQLATSSGSSSNTQRSAVDDAPRAKDQTSDSTLTTARSQREWMQASERLSLFFLLFQIKKSIIIFSQASRPRRAPL